MAVKGRGTFFMKMYDVFSDSKGGMRSSNRMPPDGKFERRGGKKGKGWKIREKWRGRSGKGKMQREKCKGMYKVFALGL